MIISDVETSTKKAREHYSNYLFCLLLLMIHFRAIYGNIQTKEVLATYALLSGNWSYTVYKKKK